MARPLRVIVPGVPVHVVQRGHNRQRCFLRDTDYLVYLSTLRALAIRHDCSLHAYCLMTNHVHLLLTPGSADSCTHLMRDLGRHYVAYFNRAHHRTGTLWEGRFRSCVVESAQYLLACYRYIEANPVRAGMVSHPAAYPWSSYAANCGLRSDPTVTPHPEFDALGLDSVARQAAYARLFDDTDDTQALEAIREATFSGYPLASDGFKQAFVAPLGGRTGLKKRGPPPRTARSFDPDPELDLVSGGGVS